MEEVDFQIDNKHLLDLTGIGLESLETPLIDEENKEEIFGLLLDHNNLIELSSHISNFANLQILDISSNRLTYIDDSITQLSSLKCLIAKNNLLDENCLPKSLEGLLSLTVCNFSGNQFTQFPTQLTEVTTLRALYFGSNRIQGIPREVKNLFSLEILYLGGNLLEELPVEMGELTNLTSLILCENNLQSLPTSISNLHRLESLSLHKNSLTTLPPGIVQLRNLNELSLRDNPLVVRFVLDLMFEPPSLLELAGRCVKSKNIAYVDDDLPQSLREYLDSAHRCVNPKCIGVYFNAKVEHVKFVDFCGKYRLPLLQYLCSPKCTRQPSPTSSSSDSELEEEGGIPTNKLKKVLLG